MTTSNVRLENAAPAVTEVAALRFAVLGDVEPKPHPVFDSWNRALAAIVSLHERERLDFVAGIGDLAHKGTVVQYDELSPALRRLPVPFYPIMGNEEQGGGKERYFEYLRTWNDDPQTVPDIRYTKRQAGLLFVFCTAEDGGKDLRPDEVRWIETQLDRDPNVPAFLFTHAAAPGIFADQGRSMQGTHFEGVLSRPNVIAVFSGHSHLDVDQFDTFVRDSRGVHHIHTPGIERTKAGDRHTPRFRLLTVFKSGRVRVQTYNVLEQVFEDRHENGFTIPGYTG